MGRSYDVHDVKVKLNTTLATLKDRLGIQQGASEEEIAAAWKQQMITSVSVEDISSLGIKELKRRLQEAGIKHDDCLTKKDLVGRLQENVPEQAATAERSGMMNAKTHSKGKKRPDGSCWEAAVARKEKGMNEQRAAMTLEERDV